MKTIETKADKAKGKGEKSLKPTHKRAISDNAYADFTLRLELTLSVGCRDDKAYREAVEFLDRYIGGEIDAVGEEFSKMGKSGSGKMAWIAFAMIRAEVDKAMHRSKIARERAMRRKAEKAVSQAPESPAFAIDAESQNSCGSKDAPKLNRRERRQIKQNIERELRRAARRQAAMA